MKKLFLMSFAVAILCSVTYAEVNSFNADVKEISKEHSNLVSQLKAEIAADNEVGGDKHYFDKDYTTKQYISYENEMDADYDVKMPVPEAKTNKGYYEVTEEIPAGYQIIDHNKSILMIINGKEVRFELDYTIKSDNTDSSDIIDYDENGFPFLTEDATIILKYSPRYFELMPCVYYAPSTTTSTVKYNGKDIALEVTTYAALEFGNISFVLKPNLQNIYEDFKFVRK